MAKEEIRFKILRKQWDKTILLKIKSLCRTKDKLIPECIQSVFIEISHGDCDSEYESESEKMSLMKNQKYSSHLQDLSYQLMMKTNLSDRS